MVKICCYSNCKRDVFDMNTLMCEEHYENFIKDDTDKKEKCINCGVNEKYGEREFCKPSCEREYEEKRKGKEKDKMDDIINKKEVIKPSHYHKGVNIDPILYGKEHFTHEEMKGFYKMNVIKYVTRADKKNGLEDLIKAKNYLEMLIESVENDDE